MQGLDEMVYELKVTSGDRALLQAKQGRLCLVEIGDHDVTDRYADLPRAVRTERLQHTSPAPACFLPDNPAPLFRNIDMPYAPLCEEELFGEEWLHFLSDEQQDVKNQIRASLNEAMTSTQRPPFVAFVKGGAGTGKTALLLSLALEYADSGRTVDFRCSPAVGEYLGEHRQINMSTLRSSASSEGARELVLLDDPKTVSTLISAIHQAQERGSLGIVVGFDPLQ